jgi:hypothetical protein
MHDERMYPKSSSTPFVVRWVVDIGAYASTFSTFLFAARVYAIKLSVRMSLENKLSTVHVGTNSWVLVNSELYGYLVTQIP